ncbi:MAG: hypothetical protein RBR65_06200 [Aliarcobacter sp.]|jgi:hypothetical protein|nr:hypothetical protein [Aliarcobacter sp.]
MYNKYLGKLSTFSLFDKKELEQQKYIQEINIIAEKYNILENENQLIGSTDKNFLYLIDFILNKKEIPQDIETLFLENIFLKEQINSYLEKKLEMLIKNDSANFFKEISDMIFILKIGIKEEILNSYANFNHDSISKLFRYYENSLKDLDSRNKELFILCFDSYIILLNIFIQLCTINTIDSIKIKDINPFIELMTESINILKFNIHLDEISLKKLNNIQGKNLYYFSHLDNIEIDIKNLDMSIKKYYLCIERQRDGYILSKDSDFPIKGDNSHSDEFLIYKNYSSILILKLINKLKFLNEEIYFHNEFFQAIIRFYYKIFSNEINNQYIFKNIKIFEETLLNNFVYGYNNTSSHTEISNYHIAIDDFIFSQKDFNNKNLESIYKILLFAKDINEFKYFSISQILAESLPAKNQYHEFYKLSILDLMINMPLNIKYTNQKKNILNEIYSYIINNDISYELLSIYSKLYLNLALIFSVNLESIEKTKTLYASFIELTNIEIYKIQYSDIIHKILDNLKLFEPNIKPENIIYQFRIRKNLELEKSLNKISSQNMSKLILDDEEYEINY